MPNMLLFTSYPEGWPLPSKKTRRPKIIERQGFQGVLDEKIQSEHP